MFLNKYIFGTVAKRTRCTFKFVIFELRLLATKSEKRQFGLVFVLMKGEKKRFLFGKLIEEAKVLIKEKSFKDFK